MNRKINNITATIRTAAKVSVLVMMFAFAASAQTPALSSKMVTLYFVDSVMVNDTLIRIGDIARVECADAALAGQVRAMTAGEAAPAGFSRYINSEDLLMYNVRPHLKGVNIAGGNMKRIKVASDYTERSVGQYEGAIRSYVENRTGWAKGEWELSITNPQLSWKSGAGDVEIEVTGLENQYLKGNTSLTLIARQGSRTSRIPVMCRISVKANVLTATRAIERGEEFNGDNSKAQVIDITNFAYAPLRLLPEAGTKAAARAVQAGNILHDKMLRAIPIVARGDQVRIHYIGERINVSVLGVARDNGGSGDRIWVENLQTRKLIRAAVSGKGSVVVHKEGDRS